MLTTEQINQIRAKSGLPPKSDGVSNYVGKYDYLIEQPKKQSMFMETLDDFKQTGSALKNTYQKTQDKISNIASAEVAGEQGKLRSFGQAFGTVAGGVSRGIGDVLMGAIKAVLPQAGEDAVKKGIEVIIQESAPILTQLDKALGRPVGTTIDAYKALPEQSKRDVDSLLGISEFAFDIAGAGVAKKAGKKAIDTGVDITKKVAQETAKQGKKLVTKGEELLGETAYNKLLQTSRDLVKMSPTASKNEAKWNKNTPEFLANEFIIDEKTLKPKSILQLIDSDGRRLENTEAINALRKKYNEESRAFNSLLKDSGEYVSLNNFKTKSLNSLDDLKWRGADYDDAVRQLNREINAYSKNFKDRGIVDGDDLLIKIDDFNKIKSGLWAKTSNFNPNQADKLLSDVSYRMGQTAKDMIEDTVQDTAVKKMNQRLGDFASAINVLEKAQGKVVPGGFFGRQLTRIAGTIAGTPGGVAGSLLGNITGGVLADLAANPKIKTTLWSKIVSQIYKQKGGQSIIDDAVKILQKRGQQRASIKLLEAPKFIPLTPKSGASGLMSQDEAQKLINELRKIDPNILPKGKGEILKSKPLKTTNPLIQEAKKYKSAEEFVKEYDREIARGIAIKNVKTKLVLEKMLRADRYDQSFATGIDYLKNKNINDIFSHSNDLEILKETFKYKAFLSNDIEWKKYNKFINSTEVIKNNKKEVENLFEELKKQYNENRGLKIILNNYNKSIDEKRILDDITKLNPFDDVHPAEKLISKKYSDEFFSKTKIDKNTPYVHTIGSTRIGGRMDISPYSGLGLMKQKFLDILKVNKYKNLITSGETKTGSRFFKSLENDGFIMKNDEATNLLHKLDKEYMDGYGSHGNVYKINTEKLNDFKPKTLKELMEMPIKTKSQLTDIWNKANKK